MSKAKYISKLVDASGSTTSANVSYTGTLTGGTGILNIGSGQIYKDASGNVGIGTSSVNSGNRLDVVKSVTTGDLTTQRHIRVGVDTNNNYSGFIGYGSPIAGQTGGLILQSYDNNIASNTYLNPNGGNVGIGTTAPNNKLTVGAPNSNGGSSCVASFSGANVANLNTSGMVVITPTDSIAADIGGSIGFAANGTIMYPTGTIAGRRENATANNYASYMQFSTCNSIGTVVEKMRIDASGRVTKPYQPAFHAISGDAPTTGVEWVFNAVTFNRGNYYNATTGRFTAPVTGVYYFYVFGLAGYADVSDIRISLRVNSVAFAGARFILTKSAAAWQTLRGQAVMNLNAGDYVSPWNDQSAIAFHTDANYTGFGGYLIG